MARKQAHRPASPQAPTSGLQSSRIRSAWTALETVADPEIPTLNIVELGMIVRVREQNDLVAVDLTPTFSGCPALELIQKEIIDALARAGMTGATVRIVYDPPWTTERISDEGRRKLKKFGLAPPATRCEGGTPDIEKTPCPYCNSSNTEMESMFGPTLCRSIHYCHACHQSFEHFKAV